MGYITKMEEIETRTARAVFYRYPKAIDLEVRRTVNSHYVKGEDGKLLWDPDAIHARWVRFCSTLLSTKSSKIKFQIIEGHGRMSVDATLGALQSLQVGWYTQRAIENEAAGLDNLSTL